mgnify:CR=1 FL=1
MSTKIICAVGGIRAVYDDRLLPLFDALGSVRIERASEVEWDSSSREWLAVHKASGQVIGRSRNRQEAVRQEVEWLERRVSIFLT